MEVIFFLVLSCPGSHPNFPGAHPFSTFSQLCGKWPHPSSPPSRLGASWNGVRFLVGSSRSQNSLPKHPPDPPPRMGASADWGRGFGPTPHPTPSCKVIFIFWTFKQPFTSCSPVPTRRGRWSRAGSGWPLVGHAPHKWGG